MIRTIPLKIQNEYITGDKGMIGAAGSHNDVILRMEFSGMWDGLTKMVQFRDALGEATIEVLLTADMLEADDTSVYLVPVPNGAKKYAGEMTLCIKGAAVSAQKETRATLAVYGRFTVAESKWSAEAETEADVPASNVEKLQGQIENVLATIVDARKAATEAAKSAEGAALSQSRAQTSEQYAGEYAQDAADSATAAANSAASASDSAASAAESIKHAPRINADGKWELWDATKNAYVATEYTAIGKDGTRGRGWYQYVVTTSNLQIYSWTGWPTAPKWGEGDWLYDPDNGNVGLCTVRIDNADGSGNANITYKGTLKGKDGTKWWTYAYPIGITAALEKIMSKSNLPDADIGDYVLHTMSNAGIVFEITGETEDGSLWVVKEKCTLRGTDGTTPHIGANGNWFLGETDTGVKAAAEAATHETAGIVKPSADFDITEDGTLSLYKAIAVNSLTLNKDSVYEIGTAVTGLDAAWVLNKPAAEQTITVPEYAVTIENIGADVRSTTELTGNAATQWNVVKTQEKTSGTITVFLHVKDDRGADATKLGVVQWINGVYTGAAEAPATIDSAFILTLTKSLQGGKGKTFTVNAATGAYIWYACSISYGTPAFNVGGFDGGFSKVATFDFTNSSGYTEEYQVWRSDNAGLGSTTVKVS